MTSSFSGKFKGTLVWIGPFYNRSGFAVGCRSTVLALHEIGIPIRIISVNEVEEGLNDCDLEVIKSLENTPVIPPVTVIIHHVPNPSWLTIQLPEPFIRIIATTFDSSVQGNRPPEQWLQLFQQFHQVWVHCAEERKTFIEAGLPPEKVHVVPFPHSWKDSHFLPPLRPDYVREEKPFRFLSIAMFLPRRRWDTLIEAYLEEFKHAQGVELYLKVNYPSWHPVPGKPRQDLYQLIRDLRDKTKSSAPIILDEELGTRMDIVHLIDSCNVYISTDTAMTSPVTEARLRKRLVVVPAELTSTVNQTVQLEIPVDPDAKRPIDEQILQYQPHHEGATMPLLHIHDVRETMRKAFTISDAEKEELLEYSYHYVTGADTAVPVILETIQSGWEHYYPIPQKQPKSKVNIPSGENNFPSQIETHDIIYIYRSFGLGDVLMTLPVIPILQKKYPKKKFVFVTSPVYRDLVRMSPVVADFLFVRCEEDIPDDRNTTTLNLNQAKYGISDRHEIDAFLQSFGCTTDNSSKTIPLRIPQQIRQNIRRLIQNYNAGKRIIVIHAAKGDPNRTWPRSKWKQVIDRFLTLGDTVITIGNTQNDATRGVFDYQDKRIVNLINRLSLPEVVGVLDIADLLITTDSGPVQLAGATDIPIVGIYTVVPGKNRLPYRHGIPGWNAISIQSSCSYANCYQYMHADQYINQFMEKRDGRGLTPPEIFSQWCLADDPYACLKKMISPETVLQSADKILAEGNKIVYRNLLSAGKSLLNGEINQARMTLESNHRHYQDDHSLFGLSLCAVAEKNTEQAQHFLQRLLQVNPGHYRGQCLLAALRLGLTPDSTNFTRFLPLPAGDYFRQASLRYFVNKTDRLSRSDTNQDWIQQIKERIQNDPVNPNLYRQLGTALKDDNRHSEGLQFIKIALAGYEKIIECNPDNFSAMIGKIKCLFSLQKYQEALQMSKTFLKANPEHVEGLFITGTIVEALGHTDSAINLYKQALSYAPEHSRSRERLDRLGKW